MRGVADVSTGYIKDVGETDFVPEAGDVSFLARDVTSATDRLRWRREHRVNPDGSVRSATQAEQIDFDAQRVSDTRDVEATRAVADKGLRALIFAVADRLGVPRATFVQEVRAVYRSL